MTLWEQGPRLARFGTLPRQELDHLSTLIPQGACSASGDSLGLDWDTATPGSSIPTAMGPGSVNKTLGQGTAYAPNYVCKKPAWFHFQSPQLPSSPLKGEEPQDPSLAKRFVPLVATKCSLRWDFTQDCSFTGTEVKGTQQRHPSPPLSAGKEEECRQF